jgi:hypothetical protein
MPVGPTTLLGATPAVALSDAVSADTAGAAAANIKASDKTRIQTFKPMLPSRSISSTDRPLGLGALHRLQR